MTDHIDYKTRCELLTSDNSKLITENDTLKKTIESKDAEIARLNKEWLDTITSHNAIRDQMITMLIQVQSYVSQTRMLTPQEAEMQKKQQQMMAAIQAQQQVAPQEKK